MSFEHAANELLRRACDDSYDGFGVIFTDSEIMQRIQKRRAVTREKEQRRLSDVVRAIVTHLREGGAVASANRIAELGGFADSISVTQGRGQLVRAVAERFRSGDNVWADPAGSDGIIVLHFWHDPTHGRVF
jgi:hypothetical protein